MSAMPGPFEVTRNCSSEIEEENATGLGRSSFRSYAQRLKSFVPRRAVSSASAASQAAAVTLTDAREDGADCSPESVVQLFPPKQELPPSAGETRALEAPERNYNCNNYDTCLSLAAALDWRSFSCSNCNGCVNKQVLWRAHHAVRNNSTMRKLCDLPDLRDV